MAGTHTAQDDPGWPKGRKLLALLVPFGHVAAMRGVGGGDQAIGQLRLLLLSLWQALLLLGVVLFFALPVSTDGTDEPLAWMLLGIGGVSAVAGGSFARRRPLTCDTPDGLANQYRTAFFIGVALVDSAALLGFVASFLVSAVWPYLVALVPTAIGFALFAPTRARLEAVDRELQASGCQHSLRAGLFRADGSSASDLAS